MTGCSKGGGSTFEVCLSHKRATLSDGVRDREKEEVGFKEEERKVDGRRRGARGRRQEVQGVKDEKADYQRV